MLQYLAETFDCRATEQLKFAIGMPSDYKSHTMVNYSRGKWKIASLKSCGDEIMPMRQRRYPKEEFARRGNEIYDRDIRSQAETNDKGKYVAIDIETGALEIDTDEIAAYDRLAARLPDAQTWMTRVGYGYIRRFGAGRARKAV